ncbi:succinyldiaminopimelate aminotransferase [Tamilnaduibacter salinus]|uniref:2-oxoadipate dioxygenase/decarboxylase n=1 Tax=Tamilnaduibacter salinus TaxID=1484056 RepID=A0A2A2HZG8_9GAMM|nr:DUF1338 domain-containing protein [Tamilnaduibacter salinus]PAV24757.1 succinyldiaminopimelate aminotransferase [Tamilnaduibacter salinus]
MHSDRHTLFQKLWEHYLTVTPSAQDIHRLLGGTQGQAIVNDHIALRTFNLDPVRLDRLAEHFRVLGYQRGGEYHFDAKKLYARHYEHPDPTAPKVFISELLVDQCSPTLQAIVGDLVAQVDPAAVDADDFLYSGAHWSIDEATYRTLLEESEYAAWMAAWGWRPNHFTVSVNALEQYTTLASVNEALKDAGYRLNDSGGEIKGSPEVLLEQSSTLADEADVRFRDRTARIPSCFYEFAKRYPDKDGKLYGGFVPASADKIFESTHAAGR